VISFSISARSEGEREEETRARTTRGACERDNRCALISKGGDGGNNRTTGGGTGSE
jgi:hypothetical protein